MKKHSSLIMPVCMIFLFTMCKKDFKLPPSDMGVYPRAATIYEWGFDTNGDLQGWTAGNATATVSGGSLNLTTTSTDPLIMSPDNLNISGPATYKFVHVVMKNNSSVTSGRIFFTTTTDATWSQAKSKGFTISANTSNYVEYIVDMSTVAGWSGTIKQIRIDPLDPAAGSGQTVNIDVIRVTEVATTINDWRFDNDGNMEGWTAGNATAAVLGGTFNLTTTSSDPLIMSPDNLNMTNPATYKFIHVDMKNYSSVTSARIFFTTNTDTTWSQAKSKGFTIKADTGYYGSYIVDMSTVAGWSGTIKRIRVDPLDSGTISGQQVKIDFIRITDNQSHRGVMSPGEGITAGDADTLKNIWRANVMRWQLYSGKNLSTLDSFDTWLTTKITELDNAFALCEPLGIQLLIDMHFTPKGHNSTNGLLIFYDQAANDKLVQAWQTLATRYKDRTGLYGYDLINEPLQFTTPLAGCDYKTTQQKIGNAIRQIDLKTPIFISVNNGDGPDGFNGFTPVNLTNVIYEVHMYQPHEYTQQLIPGGKYQTSYTYPGTIAGVSWNPAQMTTVL
ncbi:MAG TPA: cellulase family glycosylhydrolase, partial [Puia sp.]|nr:cellulase family glycosylhydrolase [Puia sp.]